MILPANEPIVSKLREVADLLKQQRANGYRISAYRRAAKTVEDLARPIEDIVRGKGLASVIELPGIGRGIGAAIVDSSPW